MDPDDTSPDLIGDEVDDGVLIDANVENIPTDTNTQNDINDLPNNAEMPMINDDPDTIEPPLDITKFNLADTPADVGTHGKTTSLPAPDLFAFFSMDDKPADGDDGDGDNKAEEEAPPQKKRGESMSAMPIVTDEMAELSFQNLKQFNLDNPLNKEEAPGSVHSIKSQQGSDSGQVDLNVEEQINANLQNNHDEPVAPPIEDTQTTQNNDGIVANDQIIDEQNVAMMGIAAPSLMDHNEKHLSRTSLPTIPTVIHDDAKNDSDASNEHANADAPAHVIVDDDVPPEFTSRERIGTMVVHDDEDGGGGLLGTPGFDAISSTQPQVDEDAEYNYDIERDSDEQDAPVIADDASQPVTVDVSNALVHTKRQSISDMVNNQLGLSPGAGSGSDGADMGAALNGISGLVGSMNGMSAGTDDEDENDNDHSNWMQAAKKWMEKEKSYKEQLFELEEELNRADQQIRDMDNEFDRRIARMEEDKNEVAKDLEEKLEALEMDKGIEIDRLNGDNQKMAYDLSLVRDEFTTLNEQIKTLTEEKTDAVEALDNKKMEWEAHTGNCPLLNPEIAKAIENERKKEIKVLRQGSQQMDDNIAELLKESGDQKQEIDELEDEKKTYQSQLLQTNTEIDALRQRLKELEGTHNKTVGALEENRTKFEEEQNKRITYEQELQALGNQYDMLMAYSNEQAQVLEMAEFVPKGIDPAAFETIKTKRSLFMAPRGGSRSVVQSMGGMEEFADHMRTISNMSNYLKNGAMDYAYKDDSSHYDTASQVSESTDLGSIASNFTRYSFQAYHTHDASKEFFYLLSLCVKLSLAQKYGISPDITPKNDHLWSQALANNIKFHEFYDFLHNELTNLYEHKHRTQQGTIANVVVTDRTKIRQMRDRQQLRSKLIQQRKERSVAANMYDEYTRGVDSTTGQLQAISDRTVFSPNDDFFGGSIKVTTRAQRSLKLEAKRSSKSSRDNKRRSSNNNKKRRSGRKRKESSANRRSSKRKQERRDVEPGNDANDHPLNDDDVKHRNSQKLSAAPNIDQSNAAAKPGHLTQKSLKMLNPDINPTV